MNLVKILGYAIIVFNGWQFIRLTVKSKPSISEIKCKKAVTKINKESNKIEISIGALVWLIHNRHKEALAPYGLKPESFEQMANYYNAEGVIMQTAKVLTRIEKEIDG